MSRRSRRALRYALGFTWTALGTAAAAWMIAMALCTMWSQSKTEKWMEDCAYGLRNVSDQVSLLCGVLAYEGRSLRASWLPPGDRGRTVTYSAGHSPVRGSGGHDPFFRYLNENDFGRIGDEVPGGKSLNVTVKEK